MKKKGMTLIELMATALIISLVVISLLTLLISSINYVARARELTIVNDDLKDVLEKIKSTPFFSITENFPNNSPVSQNIIGGFLLQNENIIVNYPNGESADPLEITVTATWTGIGNIARSHTFRTLRSSML